MTLNDVPCTTASMPVRPYYEPARGIRTHIEKRLSAQRDVPLFAEVVRQSQTAAAFQIDLRTVGQKHRGVPVVPPFGIAVSDAMHFCVSAFPPLQVREAEH